MTANYLIIHGLFLAASVSASANAADVPPVVVHYAEAFAHMHPIPEGPRSGRGFTDDYAFYFFEGYTHPGGGRSSASPAMAQDAYTHGQAYWRDHPSERGKIFAAFGYVAVEREGVWSRGVERSVFVPADAAGEQWWMSSFGDVPWREVGLDLGGARSGRFPIRIHGYLSPKGHYGHLDGQEREVLVTAGAPADRAGR